MQLFSLKLIKCAICLCSYVPMAVENITPILPDVSDHMDTFQVILWDIYLSHLKAHLLAEFPIFSYDDRIGLLLSGFCWAKIRVDNSILSYQGCGGPKKWTQHQTKTQQTCLKSKWQEVIQSAIQSEVSQADVRVEIWRTRSLEVGSEYKRKKIGRKGQKWFQAIACLRSCDSIHPNRTTVYSFVAYMVHESGRRYKWELPFPVSSVCPKATYRLVGSWAQVKEPSFLLAAWCLLITFPSPICNRLSSVKQQVHTNIQQNHRKTRKHKNKRNKAKVRGWIKGCRTEWIPAWIWLRISGSYFPTQ